MKSANIPNRRRRTALKAAVAVIGIVISATSAGALMDGARLVEIVGFWGSAFAAGAGTVAFVSELRKGDDR
jgi:hypothetical protein